MDKNRVSDDKSLEQFLREMRSVIVGAIGNLKTFDTFVNKVQNDGGISNKSLAISNVLGFFFEEWCAKPALACPGA
mgnify:CR=1 FL=1